MSDVYVTPYLNELQMTSGTLAYSFGLGKRSFRRPFGMRRNCWQRDAASWSHLAMLDRRSAPKSQAC